MLTRSDKVLIFLLVLVASLLFATQLRGSRQGDRVIVRGSKAEKRFPLNKDRLVNVQGELGKLSLEIKGGRARIADSCCRQKICVNTGWITKPRQTIVCLPNRVLVMIEGSKRSPIDGIAY